MYGRNEEEWIVYSAGEEMGHKITNYGIKKTYTKEERIEALKKALEIIERIKLKAK